MNQEMTVEEFIKSLEQGEQKDFGKLFNENVQTAFQARMFNRLKFEARIAKYLFVPMLLTFPFDPVTGATDRYNMREPFRPSQRPEFFLKMIKAACHKDEKLKKHYMDAAEHTGVWDTEPTKYFTDNDRKILFIYRRPLTVSQPAIKLNSETITGSKFPGNYLLNTKQNPLTGEYEGDICLLQKLGFLANSVMRKEIGSFNKAVEDSIGTCLSLDLGRGFITSHLLLDIKDLKSTEAMNARSSIRSCYPVGQVAQLRVMPIIGIDVTPISGKFTTYVQQPSGEEVEELMPTFRGKIKFEENFLATDKYAVHDRVDSIIGHYFPKDPSRKKPRNAENDLYADFAVLEYVTAEEAASFKSDKDFNAAAQKMEATALRNPLFDRRKKEFVFEGLEEFFENMGEFYTHLNRDNFIERLPQLLFSNYRVATDTLEERALRIFADTYPLSEYKNLYDDDIAAMHSEVLMEMFPEDYAELVDQIEEKLEDGQEEFTKLIEESTDMNFDTEDEITIDGVDQITV